MLLHVEEETRKAMSKSIKSQFLFEKSYRIFNREKISLISRERTYENWAFSHIQNVSKLSEAGFYSISYDSDLVQCFFCGLVLGRWLKEDDPWLEHYRFSSSCTFLNIKKEFQSSSSNCGK